MRNSKKSIPVIISSSFVPSFTIASSASPAVNFKYLHKCIFGSTHPIGSLARKHIISVGGMHSVLQSGVITWLTTF